MPRNIFFGFCLAALSLLSFSCSQGPSKDEFLIGEYDALTGPTATFGTSDHEGIMLAVEEANALGGVGGKKIRVITEDDQGKPEEAALVVTKLVTQNRVHAVLGEVASSNSLAAAPICQSNRVPMISPSSTNPQVTEKGDFIFRVCFIDPFQGRVMADYCAKTMKAKKVAVFRDLKSDYSLGLCTFFTARFKELGGQITTEQVYSQGDIDFKAQLTAMRGMKPEAIYVPGYYTEVGLIAKQARQLGISVPLMGGDGFDSEKLFEIAGAQDLEGCLFSNHYTPESTDPKVVQFVTKYKAKYNGKVPDALATLGYDAALVLLDSARRAKSFKGEDLRDAIAATKNFPGVTGKITIDEKRNALKSAVVLRITGGKAKYVATVQP